MYIGDVGQNNIEEINFQPFTSTGGENYGWRVMEGTSCYNPGVGCNTSGKVAPIAEYTHDFGCSITGGYIYKGEQYPQLKDVYFYGDFCSGIIFGLNRVSANQWDAFQVADTSYLISTFGEDEQGKIYFADYGTGKIFQIKYKNLEEANSWIGSVSVESDKNVVAVGRPHVDAEVASYDSFSAGALSAYVPMLFKDAFGGSYDAALYVQNVDPIDTANITIKYYDSAGNLSCTVNGETIAPLASKGYWVPSQGCLPAGWVGGVAVTSDQPIVAIGRPHIGAEVMTYNGFSTGSLSSYIPMLFKDAFGGSYDSAFYVQNVDPTNTATVTIKYYDSAGNLSCTVNGETIAPFASKGYWVPSQGCLPAGWVGGVVVTSDQPIVTVGRPHIGTQVTTYNGFSGGTASSYVPMLFKGAFGGTYDAAFYVQNVDPTNTATLTIQYYDSAGNLSCTVNGETVAPLASKGYWVPSQGCLPAGWVGGVVVTSDQPIVAVGRPHIGAQVTTYNGFTAGSVSSYLPMLFKDAFGGSYDSAFYIQNTEASTAAVTIKFYNSAGVLTCTRTDNIPALATLGLWVPSLTCIQ